MSISAGRTRELLLAWHDAAVGEPFKPRAMAAYLQEHHGLPRDTADNLASMYLDFEGVAPVEEMSGHWLAGPRVRPLVQYFDWCVGVGDLDLAGARYLAEHTLHGAPESVQRMQEVCRHAVRQLNERIDASDGD